MLSAPRVGLSLFLGLLVLCWIIGIVCVGKRQSRCGRGYRWWTRRGSRMMLYLFFYGGARPGPLVGLVPVFLCMAADWTAATAPSKGLQQLYFANYDLSGGKLGARQLPGLQDLVFFCLVFF